MKQEKYIQIGSTAILVDGSFFLKRYYKCFPNSKMHSPKTVAKNMYTMLLKHVEGQTLYRIFYYDSPPLDNRVHNPITSRNINYGNTDLAKFRKEFHKELKKLRKVALRFGYLVSRNSWKIHSRHTKPLIKKEITIDDLTEHDVYYEIKQKGVDIRIGLDIASLSYKKQVNRIILVSGDSDFVPAAKLARREGIDFILDPMWHIINDELFEHIDGLKSLCKKPK